MYGVKAQAILAPADAKYIGATDLTLKVERGKFSGNVAADNYGTPFLGRVKGSTSLGVNDMFKHDGRTEFFGQMTKSTDELSSGRITHNAFIGDNGTKVLVSARRQRTKAGDSLAPFGLKGSTDSAKAEFSHALIRSRKHNWHARAGFEYINSKLHSLGSLIYVDKLRVFTLGTSYDRTDGFGGGGVSFITGSLRHGVDVLSSSEYEQFRSRAKGKTNFLSARMQAVRLQLLGQYFSIYAGLTGQYGFNTLLSAEEFSVGGMSFGRGYDNGELGGTSGLAGKAELRYRKYSHAAPMTFVPYVFYDAGVVWKRNVNGIESKSLASTGFGTRFGYKSNFNIDITESWPVTRKVDTRDSNDPVLQVRASLKF